MAGGDAGHSYLKGEETTRMLGYIRGFRRNCIQGVIKGEKTEGERFQVLFLPTVSRQDAGQESASGWDIHFGRISQSIGYKVP